MAILAYLVARMSEPSTWRGLVLIATAVGAHLTEAQVSQIVEIGLFLAGLLGALLPDAKPAAKG
jgi:hypothetical protein